MNIGNKIKAIRKEKKLTQKELGKLIGKSEISIRKYEASDNVPLDAILSIAKAFDIDVVTLIPGTEDITSKGERIDALRKYLESKNYFITDSDLLKEIESHILEYIEFKMYQKNKQD